MSTKAERMQRFARHYREKVGRDATMREVAEAWAKEGGPLPKPKDPIELLAKEFAKAESEEIKYDEVTGDPYRANICYDEKSGGKQQRFWADTDKASRDKMHKNYILRRENMVGDGLQLTLDLKHWCRINPDEEPIVPDLDLTDDVLWKMNAPKEGEEGEEAA
ncbi:MAG TPA: hypothetical protein VGX48_05135 [Pyrinomonadaceae bacterium]|jgi:hypothetical protein|nr:hypothetical protein [Pyrinomonadaceae bacterium]